MKQTVEEAAYDYATNKTKSADVQLPNQWVYMPNITQ